MNSRDHKPTGSKERPNASIEKQVKQEFEHSANKGESVPEQIENELAAQDYMVPSSVNGQEDAAFTNINADQKGRAFGVANQRNEPLDIVDKVEKRDEERWALNPASAETDE
ncbi:MAG TPA: DUF6335 family protein [Pyrinomonadaceae bacterium]